MCDLEDLLREKDQIPCLCCDMKITRTEYIRHQIEEHDGLQFVREFHSRVCTEMQPKVCVCRIRAYENVAKTLGKKG